MANLRSTSAALQAVETAATPGNTTRVTVATLQSVISSVPGRVRATSASVQLVTASIAPHIRAQQAVMQVVRQGSTGKRHRQTASSLQVVFTTGFIDNPLKRAWWFDWDGHTFYCLDLGNRGTLVYDLTSQQWTKFDTPSFDGAFNFKNGMYWQTGRKIVGGDAQNGNVWEMVPDTYLDEGWRPVTYEVRGIVFAQGNDHQQNYALRLIGSAGRTGDSIAPVLNMRFSDDEGATWSDEFPIELTTNTKQRLEFRGLGSFAHPGRIFRLYDTGGIKFIGRCEADMGE